MESAPANRQLIASFAVLQNKNFAPLASLREAQNPDERLTIARRLVADRCLYGVDKNPLAVEMAKLSLWLITLDKGRPFTFLNHALKCGDSVVGVDLDQLAHWNLDTSGTPELFAEGIRHDIEKIIALRREIAGTPVIDTRDQSHKAYLLAQAEAIAHDLRRGCGLLIASYYNELPATERERLRVALVHAFRDGADAPPDLADAADLGDPSTGSGQALRPFHWQLEFPEVFLEDGYGGFDAFVGNPPFIGGRRIRETLGDRYRRILYDLYPGSSGNADYCAFFFLRGFQHLRPGGTLGLIATNTIAQGDTRQTGLDRITAGGGTIYRATNNQPWPGQAAVVVNVVHVVKDSTQPPFVLDHKPAQHISTLLDSRKVMGEPYRLAANRDKSFQGSVVVGMGFVLDPEEAQALIAKDPRNKDVLFPYLIGQDLNSNPDQSPSRWVINFFDWPLQRGAKGRWFSASEKQQKEWLRSGSVPDDYPGPVAADYPDCLEIVRERVYPFRAKVRRKAHRVYWWHYGDKRPALYRAITPMRWVLVTTLHSKYLCFAFVRSDLVFSHALAVCALQDGSDFAVLQCAFHELWARIYSSSLETRLRYTPTDVFETFPSPRSTLVQQSVLEQIGETYHEHCRQIMLARQEGLTATYNRFHNPDETSEDIARLRELHVEMDHAVAAAYGWDDLNLGHDFHETPQGVRYTISEAPRREVLGRLLELNHQRYAEEVKAGLHEKKGKGQKRGRKAKDQPALF